MSLLRKGTITRRGARRPEEMFEYNHIWYAGQVIPNNADPQWGQTFTPKTIHKLTKIVICGYRISGAPSGNFTVSVKATASGLPVGDDLVSKPISTSAFTAEIKQIEFIFDTQIDLQAGVMYAKLFAATEPNLAVCVKDSDVYPLGTLVRKIGVWYVTISKDFWFEEWGYRK